ncbi:hypothetical protein HYV91_02085 [Candidatus Wolfebacteria bacterium]|nr:hypothetical protein [Candidatus Wolfebacteria bacterium]
MLHGLTEFAQGIYAQALERARRDGISLERAFEIEITEMTIFLAELDKKYYEEFRPQDNVAEAMRKLVEWSAFYPKK